MFKIFIFVKVNPVEEKLKCHITKFNILIITYRNHDDTLFCRNYLNAVYMKQLNIRPKDCVCTALK